MVFIKRHLKALLLTIAFTGGALVFGWLLYTNGNFDRLGPDNSRKAATGSASMWVFNGDGDLTPAARAALPAKTVPPTPIVTRPAQPAGGATATPADDEFLTTDLNFSDPEISNALKLLVASDNPGPSTVKALPAQLQPGALPAQYRPGPYNPIAAPTISYDTFLSILRKNNSPAAGEAATMYTACVRLYCDPAVALAFFMHESSMGTQGVAVQNKSFGNIRCVPGAACRAAPGNGSFKVYASWTEGLVDWVVLMRDVYAAKWKLFSVEQIVPRYAPSADNNDPVGYINSIKTLADRYRGIVR